jgi:mannose-6-phosphate isomerase-like protein (cupin superfamily)
MPPSIVSINAIAIKLEQPFSIRQLATVASLSLSVYLCQGQVNWHRHLDEDELFLVHEGVVSLDTQRGRLTLHSEELAVVPKGLGHRTGSQLRSIVLVLRPTVLTSRTNGHRQGVVDTDPPIEKVRLSRVLATISEPYRGMTVGRVEDFDVLLVSATGFGPPDIAAADGVIWLCLRGAVGIETDQGAGTRLEAGELTVLPPGQSYRITSAETSLLLTLARAGGHAD